MYVSDISLDITGQLQNVQNKIVNFYKLIYYNTQDSGLDG